MINNLLTIYNSFINEIDLISQSINDDKIDTENMSKYILICDNMIKNMELSINKVCNMKRNLINKNIIPENKFDNKCSIFFWCDENLTIKEIPPEKFIYNQPTHDMYKSTRNKCQNDEIKLLVKYFQKILNISKKY